MRGRGGTEGPGGVRGGRGWGGGWGGGDVHLQLNKQLEAESVCVCHLPPPWRRKAARRSPCNYWSYQSHLSGSVCVCVWVGGCVVQTFCPFRSDVCLCAKRIFLPLYLTGIILQKKRGLIEKGTRISWMYSIQVHYCNWQENWKSLKRFLRARSGVWSCRVWDIIDTRSDQAAYFGRSAEKMFDMIGWSCVEDGMRKAKRQWRNFSINGTAKPAPFFFVVVFF